MQIFVAGQLKFEGNTNFFMNPVFEAGMLHARALLEFLGLKASAETLVQAGPGRRRKDDACIEKLMGPTGPLARVSPEDAGAANPDNPDAAKSALAGVIAAAHKARAHCTVSYFTDPVDAEKFLLALQVTQLLVERHVYAPLGRQRPEIPIDERPRE